MENNRIKRNARRCRRLLLRLCAGLAMVSAALILVPAATAGEGRTALLIVTGSLFWLGLIVTLLASLSIRTRYRRSPRHGQEPGRLGLFHFFSNRAAAAADVSLLICVAGFAVCNVLSLPRELTFVLLGLAVFSFGMHWLLNGSCYQYLMYHVRRAKHELPKEKTP